MGDHSAATPAMQAVAGALGGSLAQAATFPFTSLSMIMQMHKKEGSSQHSDVRNMLSPVKPQISRSTESLGHDDSEEETKGLIDRKSPPTTLEVLKELLQDKQGWARLYSGLGSSIYGMLVIQAVYYYLYSYLHQRIPIKDTIKRTLVCASLAGAGGAVLTNPIWVVSTRQIKTGSKKSTLAELKDLAMEEGLPGMYKGLGPALILVSNPTIQYGAFEKAKAMWLRLHSRAASSPLSSYELFVLGAIGKLTATICTYPYIMAKTTLQAQSKSDDAKEQYESTFACLVGVYRQKGFQGLFSGLNSKVWQSVLTAALLFVLHDKCLGAVRRLLNK
eukprot:TRINITY_DN8374_c3_g1_i1.p1 TRINITY_DN8374_c3_g1~~TRINITY_DN8374_c3_g1_i1.p1  ORF type:complete len:342 (+),score=47.49 TRINITY_DN8374_c3_g1_i1:29-1027(+)